MGLVDRLIAYEEGQITDDDEVTLFQHLIDTGLLVVSRGQDSPPTLPNSPGPFSLIRHNTPGAGPNG